MMRKLILSVLAIVVSVSTTFAQLQAGDIAFLGYRASSPDGFSFVVLTDVPAGQVIYFTDQGWAAEANTWYNNSEAHFSWTAPAGGVSAGTVITAAENTSNVLSANLGVFTYHGGTFSLTTAGDALLAYTSTGGAAANSGSLTFLAGIYWDDSFAHASGCDATDWFNGSGSCVSDPNNPPTSSSTSGIPPGLTDGVDAIHFFPPGTFEGSSNNGRYEGITTGDKETIAAAIADKSNWQLTDAVVDITTTYYTSSFIVAASCAEPDVPTVVPVSSVVCEGGKTSLSITGSLNDATAWHVYTGSCGGASVGTTTSSSIEVSPTSQSTTYFVRGEGACTTPSICGSTTVNVKAPEVASAGFDQNVCGTSTFLGANSSSDGVWSIVQGGGGTVTSTTNNTSGFSGTHGVEYVLRWTIDDGVCVPSTDDVKITIYDNPSVASAGADQTVCNSEGATLSAAAVTGFNESGTWSIVSGAGGTIDDVNSNSTSFNGLGGSAYTLRWTVTNGVCPNSTDDVRITVNAPQVAAAGADQNVCGTSTFLGANSSSDGYWSFVQGGGRYNYKHG